MRVLYFVLDIHLENGRGSHSFCSVPPKWNGCLQGICTNDLFDGCRTERHKAGATGILSKLSAGVGQKDKVSCECDRANSAREMVQHWLRAQKALGVGTP